MVTWAAKFLLCLFRNSKNLLFVPNCCSNFFAFSSNYFYRKFCFSDPSKELSYSSFIPMGRLFRSSLQTKHYFMQFFFVKSMSVFCLYDFFEQTRHVPTKADNFKNGKRNKFYVKRQRSCPTTRQVKRDFGPNK